MAPMIVRMTIAMKEMMAATMIAMPTVYANTWATIICRI